MRPVVCSYCAGSEFLYKAKKYKEVYQVPQVNVLRPTVPLRKKSSRKMEETLELLEIEF